MSQSAGISVSNDRNEIFQIFDIKYHLFDLKFLNVIADLLLLEAIHIPPGGENVHSLRIMKAPNN